MSEHDNLAWHFIPSNYKLANGDGRIARVGEKLTVSPPLKLCIHGLHFARRAIDALEYAPGPIVCRVRIGGEVLETESKGCCTERTVLAMADASDTLRAFARWCALSVIHLWDCPPVVRQFLETGDESIRAAAWAAARAAAWAAARDVARDAQNAELERQLLKLLGIQPEGIWGTK